MSATTAPDDGGPDAGWPDSAWFERFRQRVNDDPELAAIGGWFSTDIAIAFGARRFALRVREGRITAIEAAPRFDRRTAFTIRAPHAVWARFLSPEPEPLYHDFFAMLMRVPDFVVEGDTLVAMQNARALHRMMNLMQGMGTGHG